ncbi:cupin domain-containing protein [Streptomyces sp. NPDC004788]
MAEKVSLKFGEGRSFWFMNGLYTVKLSGEESGDVCSVMEMWLREGWGPPPHTHDVAESVYVLEGRLRMHLAGEAVDAGPGSYFHIPAGTDEQPEVVEESRILTVYTPGGFDKFFAEVGEPAESNTLPPLSEEPPDYARIAEIGRRHGLELKPPD